MVDAIDARLVAALTLVQDRLPAVLDELLAGELDQADRDALAEIFRAVADDLNRIVDPAAEEDRVRRRAQVWPGWPTHGRFSASGP